jgi:hypothetical protein
MSEIPQCTGNLRAEENKAKRNMTSRALIILSAIACVSVWE